jgi:hypothetical protein
MTKKKENNNNEKEGHKIKSTDNQREATELKSFHTNGRHCYV